jgi:hypothetical protein
VFGCVFSVFGFDSIEYGRASAWGSTLTLLWHLTDLFAWHTVSHAPTATDSTIANDTISIIQNGLNQYSPSKKKREKDSDYFIIN